MTAKADQRIQLSFLAFLSTTRENDRVKSRFRRFCLKFFFASCLLVIVGSAFALASRLLLPTEKNWVLFPLYDNALMAQNAAFWFSGRCYGRIEVYEALLTAARDMKKKHSEARVAYLDASGRLSGRLLGHLSHSSGTDVDVLFVSRNPNGSVYPRLPSLFTIGYRINFDRKKRWGSLTFDAELNWLFISALKNARRVQVEKIFVEPYIREWILSEAKKSGASAAMMQWASEVLRYAGSNAADHKDHMHIRFTDG